MVFINPTRLIWQDTIEYAIRANKHVIWGTNHVKECISCTVFFNTKSMTCMHYDDMLKSILLPYFFLGYHLFLL
jgi:hypothetical protein